VRRALSVLAVTLVLAAGLAAGFAMTSGSAARLPAHAEACPAGYVDAVINGQEKCLHAGEFCSASY